ncbi:MAG: mechanosensitive ion channel [Caldilineaceae bacterium]|nr:mechanosensitive ion channel [Caldilineaceae bacterium]
MDISILERLGEQWAVLLVILERLVVQRQIVALVLLALGAETIARLLSPLLGKVSGADHQKNSRRSLPGTLTRWLRALEHIWSPILAVGIGQGIIALFTYYNWPVGLLREGLVFFWLLLSYRLVVVLLYAWRDEEEAKEAHRRILGPLFFFLLILGLQRAIVGIIDISGAQPFSFSGNRISIGALYRAAFVLYAFLSGGWLIQHILTNYLLPRTNADPGIGNTVRTISRYVIISAGILATLSSLGIDLSSLAIIGAGLSIGIGFGLQELVANFISGILLLFEQSIRPGDVIEVNNKVGRVEKLRIRSTTVRTNDNVEMIVPNQTLLTSSVTTYTHSDRSVRIHIPVGVSYNSDPAEVRQILLGAARRHGLVRASPAPAIFFEGYGDSSVDFSLAIWIDDFMNMRRVSSDLRFIIWEELAKRGIEIPFPQRDLHLRSSINWDELMRREKAAETE